MPVVNRELLDNIMKDVSEKYISQFMNDEEKSAAFKMYTITYPLLVGIGIGSACEIFKQQGAEEDSIKEIIYNQVSHLFDRISHEMTVFASLMIADPDTITDGSCFKNVIDKVTTYPDIDNDGYQKLDIDEIVRVTGVPRWAVEKIGVDDWEASSYRLPVYTMLSSLYDVDVVKGDESEDDSEKKDDVTIKAFDDRVERLMKNGEK